MAKRKSPIAKDILRRVRGLYVVFLLLGIGIIMKVIWLQYGPESEELKTKAEKTTFERVSLDAERGDILARDGRILATSVPTYDIRMDFAADGLDSETFYNNVDSLSLMLASFFKDKSATAYKNLLVGEYKREKRNRYRLISPRRVSHLELKEISQFPLFRLGANRGGYMEVQHNMRVRPHGSLAMRTIGHYVNDSIKYGIEGSFNNQLKGTDGMTVMQRISGSFKVPVPDPMNVEPINGMDVVTTIDVELQDVAERALKEQLEREQADWGTVILMEVATGEIHAMANVTRKGKELLEDYNYGIGARMEPGSTFKLATLIALIEDGKMSLDHMIDCEYGRAMVGMTPRTRRLIRDSHAEGVISLRRVFEVSSNIGIAKAALEVYGENQTRFVDFLGTLGLDKPLGVEIAGERAPLINRPGTRAWHGTSLAMMSHGYAMEITPLHTLALYNAVANNGRLMRPQLVKEVKSFGRTIYKFNSEALNPAICSSETIQKVKECLEGVVDEGTARMLKNPHYTVAAKTGTAQVAFGSGGYTDRYGGRNYLGTMVGYFPADNPKYSCIVAMKTYYRPGYARTYYGTALAGPVFKSISDRVYAANPSWHESVDRERPVVAPNEKDMKSGRGEELYAVEKGFKMPTDRDKRRQEWRYVGDGESFLNSWITDNGGDNFTHNRQDNPNSAVEELSVKEMERLAKLDAVKNVTMECGTVPSVVGMGLKDAIFLLEKQGLTVAFSGAGEVLKQSIEPGREVAVGSVISLTLGNPIVAKTERR